LHRIRSPSSCVCLRVCGGDVPATKRPSSCQCVETDSHDIRRISILVNSVGSALFYPSLFVVCIIQFWSTA